VKNVLVIGSTGHVGRQAVAALKARGATVRTLVREGSEPLQDVAVVRGDMLHPKTLGPAFADDPDAAGNENLAAAASEARLKRC
jgi:uncharacterized protein YbjT (DUF2867 family)